MADPEKIEKIKAVDAVVAKFGLSFPVVLPERGCERAHWQTHAWEMVQPKLAAEAARASEMGEAPAPPQARRSNTIRVQFSDFELGEVLGEGNYSRVFLATLKTTGQQLAMKVIEKKKIERYKKQAEALMEKHVLTVAKHPFIVKLAHTFHDSSCLYIVTEYVPGGELWALAHKTGVRPSLGAFYAAELLDALEYLHANNIVHRDIKPENILITADGHIKLIDFGTAKVVGDSALDTAGNFKFGQHFKEFVGTAEYMPPEAINNKPTDFRADLWSLGGTIFHLTTGMPPFKGGSEYLTFKRVLELKYRCPVGMPDDARDLISKLLKVEARERLGGGETAAEQHAAIKAHPYFRAIDWHRLHAQTPPPPTAEEQETVEAAARLLALPATELPPPIGPAPEPPPRPKKGAARDPAAELAWELACKDNARQVADRLADVVVAVRAGPAYAAMRAVELDARRRVALHLDVRGQLTEELRIALQMPEPEPEVVDELEPMPDSSSGSDSSDDEQRAASGADGGAAALPERFEELKPYSRPTAQNLASAQQAGPAE